MKVKDLIKLLKNYPDYDIIYNDMSGSSDLKITEIYINIKEKEIDIDPYTY